MAAQIADLFVGARGTAVILRFGDKRPFTYAVKVVPRVADVWIDPPTSGAHTNVADAKRAARSSLGWKVR